VRRKLFNESAKKEKNESKQQSFDDEETESNFSLTSLPSKIKKKFQNKYGKINFTINYLQIMAVIKVCNINFQAPKQEVNRRCAITII
jgi:hypothetical protein